VNTQIVPEPRIVRTNGAGGEKNLAQLESARAAKARKKSPLAQAKELQKLLFGIAAELGESELKEDRMNLPRFVKAWTDIEERRRILLGKPLPGSLRPAADRAKIKRKPDSVPVENPKPV
jgi:hypothetical protein